MLFIVVAALIGASVLNTVLGVIGYLVLPVTIAGKLLVAGFLALMVALIAVASRLLAREARQATEAAHLVEKGDFSARLKEGGWGGLADLARAFNSMSARLQANEARRRSFLAEVTHELRTPLAIIRGEAEAISDGIHPPDPEHLGRILDAARSVELLVNDLGTLSLSDAGGLILNREPVDLAVLVNESIASLEGAAETAGVSLQERVEDGLPALFLDPARIRGVLGNLLANALRHTPRGGTITVAAAPPAGAWRSASTTPGPASRRTCSPTSSTASSRIPARPAPGSGWRSPAMSWRPTWARSRRRARPARGRRSGSGCPRPSRNLPEDASDLTA